jgi:hypothetical protein
MFSVERRTSLAFGWSFYIRFSCPGGKLPGRVERYQQATPGMPVGRVTMDRADWDWARAGRWDSVFSWDGQGCSLHRLWAEDPVRPAHAQSDENEGYERSPTAQMARR